MVERCVARVSQLYEQDAARSRIGTYGQSYRFSATGLSVAQQTVERCKEQVSRLYEQGANVVHI